MSDFNPAAAAPLHKFVLTGGPCGGKTTTMSALSERLSAHGYRVYVVPEAATLLFMNGASFGDFGTPGYEFEFQSALTGLQVSLEATFEAVARAAVAGAGAGGKGAVLLCDRGLLDGSAYV